jgi:Mce-associated membrane protein
VAEEVSRRKWLPACAAVLLAGAMAFAGWSGWSWFEAANDESLSYATARDEALRTGRENIAQLTTLDYHDVDAGIARWLDVSTGPLHDELARTDDQTRQSLREGATVSTGKVLDAAISELDQRAGTARMLASVEITVAKQGAAPTSKRNRFVAQLTRTDAGWKLSAIDQVPLGTR